MRVFFCFCVVALVGFGSSAPGLGQGNGPGPGDVQIKADQDKFTISAGQRPVLTYQSVASPQKPYVAEMFSPAGVQVLRDAPADHLHHHGLMFAVGVNGVDFWGEKGATGKQALRGKCEHSTGRILQQPGGYLTQTLEWRDAQNKLLLIEDRKVGVAPLSQPTPVTLVVWNTNLSAVPEAGKLLLDGHHYYGLGMRFLQSMDTGGRFFNAANEAGEVVRGSERLVPTKWCAYTAKADGKQVTVAIFDHPTNLRYPNKMFTMTPPFAYLSATLNLWKEKYELTTEKTLTLKYAVAVWDGETPTEQVEKLYGQWSQAE